MIFSELYGAYYNAVAAIIKEALEHPINGADIRRIVEKHAYLESALNIEPALFEERWQLLKKDGTTIIDNDPTMPLTIIQKRFLKAVSMDKRIKLFTDVVLDYDVEPLFTEDDYVVFDKYLDGDDFEDEKYIKNFRTILDAIHNQYLIEINTINRKGKPLKQIMVPMFLEFSEKDDKFRVYGKGRRGRIVANVGKIINCKKFDGEYEVTDKEISEDKAVVVFELEDRRNALRRVLLHFAHFEKEVEKIDDNKYRVKIVYNISDETEMVIRILSYGPVIKVIEPTRFVFLIKERLIRQRKLMKK